MANIQQPSQSLTGIQGMWVWKEEWIETDKAQDELLDFCNRYGFNRIMIQVHAEMKAGVYTIKFPNQLARLTARGVARGIAVEALDGDHDMARAQNHDQTLGMLDKIIDFNLTLPEGERLAAMHYDIEPYVNQPLWKNNQETRTPIMTDLLDFYSKAKNRLKDRNPEMLLSCDIPMWYDDKTAVNDHCYVTYNGHIKSLHQHVQDICDYVGVMSYRQHAVGRNSASQMIADELAYAEKIGKTICACFETIKMEHDPQITFFEMSPEEFWKQMKLLKEYHIGRSGYGGVLVHCYYGLRDLFAKK